MDEINLEDYNLKSLDLTRIIPLLQTHGMNRLVKRINKFAGNTDLDETAVSGVYSGDGTFTIVKTLQELDHWTARVEKSSCFALDVETDSIDSMKASPGGVSISVSSGEACYIPLYAGGESYL
ncbi:MAG: hypothetical protein L3J12_09230, partial [Spirochaetales bacterium]|nr:hypothetical protein [Spirochaetales bacterium]